MNKLRVLPARFRWIVLGVAAGIAIVLPVRAAFYLGNGIDTEMAPQIAYLFSPFIFGAVTIVAFIAELLLQSKASRPASRGHAFIIGVSYASLLLPWAFPGYAWLALPLNPFVLRWLVNRIPAGVPLA
jgi:hypothetical protein